MSEDTCFSIPLRMFTRLVFLEGLVVAGPGTDLVSI